MRGLTSVLAIAAASEIAAGATRIQLLPMGRHFGRDGRGPYILKDKAHAERVIAATKARLGSCDFMIDYDHQVVADPSAGAQAKAAGWARQDSLVAEDDGIWAEVQWTPAAQAAIGDREYRYISPCFQHSKAGEITLILNAALVNIPNLELAAVAAQQFGDEKPMKTIATALGLAEDATEEAILAAINSMKTSATAVAKALGLAETATGDEVATAAAAAIAGGDPDPAKFVPIGELTALRSRLDAIEAKDAEATVDAAIAAGKLTPANRDWGLKAFRADPDAFATAMGNQPPVLKPGGEGGGDGDGADNLTDEEVALCSSMGWDRATYAAQKKSQEEGE